MDGFGFSLTGGSAIHLNSMSPEARNEILRELFSTDDSGIGVSYIRISIDLLILILSRSPMMICRRDRLIGSDKVFAGPRQRKSDTCIK